MCCGSAQGIGGQLGGTAIPVWPPAKHSKDPSAEQHADPAGPHLQQKGCAVGHQVWQVGVHRQRGAQAAPLVVVEHAVRVQAHL